MKLIIDIPEEKYKTIQEGMYCGMLDADLYRDIKNGTPLKDEVMIATLMSLVTDKDYKPNLEGESE